MNNQKDLFVQFLEAYVQGEFLKALRMILKNPSIRYDELSSKEPLFPYIVNFADASVRKRLYDVHQTMDALIYQINASLSQDELIITFCKRLEWELSLINVILLNQDQNEVIIAAPIEYIPFLEQRKELSNQIEQLRLAKPEFLKCFEEKIPISHQQPWHLFSYDPSEIVKTSPVKGKVPLFFLQPASDDDWNAVLLPYAITQAFFVFESIQDLIQMFQFPAVRASLNHPEHFLYVLDKYPDEQFLAQNFNGNWSIKVQPYLFLKNVILEEALPFLLSAIESYVEQPRNILGTETSASDLLYRVSKRYLFRMESEKYGPSRCMTLRTINWKRSWIDLHKGLKYHHQNVGPAGTDYFEKKIFALGASRKPRSFAPSQKIRIAHVVPQVVDGGHAPTRLLTKLLSKADQAWFDLFLLCTEAFGKSFLEYPVNEYSSPSSALRGDNTLNYLNQLGVKIWVEDHAQTYQGKADQTIKLLHDCLIDIVVFHGADEVNYLTSQACDVPIRVMFEHGSPPDYPAFDLAILSTEEAVRDRRENYQKAGMECCCLNFCVDVKENWAPEPFSKESLGFPADSFVMTTISNHLESRLSKEMCLAIVEILKRCPKAFYAPMGNVDHPEKLYEFFKEQGVRDRILFLGSKSSPSQYARSMELYLNEFPFGSCLGMLDAMGAGCPVVSMYDSEGPSQARYAGNFLGVDRVITSGKREDYVDLACRLIQDPNFYKEWSEHAKQQYEKLSDVEGYVKKFEKILEYFIDYHLKHKNKN